VAAASSPLKTSPCATSSPCTGPAGLHATNAHHFSLSFWPPSVLR